MAGFRDQPVPWTKAGGRVLCQAMRCNVHRRKGRTVNWRLALLMAAGLGLTALPAHAETKAQRSAPRAKSMTVISLKAKASTIPYSATVRLLRAADANEDNRVSELELKRFVQYQVLRQVERRVPKLDSNGDGQVTRAEVPRMSTARFARFDLNDDGAFTVWELAQVMRRQALERCRHLFASLDADADGVLSISDVEHHERFAQLQTRKSGERSVSKR